MSSAQWLATKELVKDDGEMVFEDGISRLCPKHSKILKSAVEGTYPRWFLVVQFGSPSGVDVEGGVVAGVWSDVEGPARPPARTLG
ncbi:hypothetical protein [Streptomyces sp. NBC_01462]|uniref:hypothetical protein n=1 Tax=Streptomyces sp. NBC_01462 TaxID=2903876 RepID=UPI002E35B034|nr:hypothetical protein [Streptomyces sp. NBC_01462]